MFLFLPVTITASLSPSCSTNNLLMISSGQIMKRISSCTQPYPNTPPPTFLKIIHEYIVIKHQRKNYLLAKSTCRKPKPSSSIVPSLLIWTLELPKFKSEASHLGKDPLGWNFLSNVTTPTGPGEKCNSIISLNWLHHFINITGSLW